MLRATFFVKNAQGVWNVVYYLIDFNAEDIEMWNALDDV